MSSLSLILNDVRSAHNVGAIFRSADAFGIAKLYLCGITPYPTSAGDSRPPHVRSSVTHKITKTALGAEKTVAFEYQSNIQTLISRLKAKQLRIYALEQAPSAQNLAGFKPEFPAALIVGNELSGISNEVLALTDTTLEIPMRGEKESLNVAAATAIALYTLSR